MVDSDDDLVNLEVLNDNNVLNAIRDRYERETFYTNIADILVAVNPFKPLGIYDRQTKSRYNHESIGHRLPPHIYGTSMSMHASMLHSGESQCCVVSGESGAGKTETVKFMIDHVIHLCHSDVIDLQDRILQINQLLEAFGNAKTSMNDNSSRFGKFLELHCTTSGKVLGASVTEYLLEKSRVVNQSKGEGNYHIFNYLLAGLPEEQLESLLINRHLRWRYLHNDNHLTAEKDVLAAWSLRLQQLISSMTSVGLSIEDVYNLFTILSAVLNIGEISFEFDDSTDRAYVSDTIILDRVAVLLGLDSDDLETALTTNVARTNDLTIKSYKTIGQANDCREAIAKALYSRLFGWIVQRINLLLLPVGSLSRHCSHVTLGFLDIFGFEDFSRNSFEQLCINAANEQLHFYFIQHVFAWEQVEYEQEEINAQSICYQDNKELVNLLLEKPIGLFALLDEESRFPQADDSTLVSKFNAHCSFSEHFVCLNRSEPSFAIRHFAGKVIYNADGFLAKNRDTLSLMLTDCLKTSSDTLVSSLFHSMISRTGSLIMRPGSEGINTSQSDLIFETDRRQRKRLDSNRIQHHRKHSSGTRHRRDLTGRKQKTPLTISAHFRNSLVDLMERILVTQPHFVRCIKPNAGQEPDRFVDSLVQHQLRYTGIMETVDIRQRGFPVRMSFKAFLDRYKFVSFPLLKSLVPSRENCMAVLESAIHTHNYQIGRTKVFLKQRHVDELSHSLHHNNTKVITTQKVVRGKLARIRFGDLLARKHMEERTVGNFLMSISSKNTKMLESLMGLNEEDLKRMERKLERESKRTETFKKKLIKSNSDSRMEDRQAAKRERANTTAQMLIENVDSKNGFKRTAVCLPTPSAQTTEPITRNFSSRNHAAWCRIDCFERQHHVASYKMGNPVLVIDGAENPCEPSRISFGKMPSHTNDSKVLKIRSCIGKGLQLHQDDDHNLWATRHGKNPIFARGYTLCPELIKLDGKLTQGVPMKVFDVSQFETIVKEECDNFDDGDEAALKEKLYATSKVCMSFIKDTVVDEETPCWVEIWMLKHLEKVKGCIRDQKLLRHVQSRLETSDQSSTPSSPPLLPAVVSSSSSPPRTRSAEATTTTPCDISRVHAAPADQCRTPSPIESRVHAPVGNRTPSPIAEEQQSTRWKPRSSKTPPSSKKHSKEETPSSPPTGGVSSTESSPPMPVRSQAIDSREGMSYRQVFGIRPTDYFFDIEPPSYTKQRRHSDSDSDSLRDFLQSVLPRQASLDAKEKSSAFQPKKWIKRARKKSEDRKKGLAMKM